MVGWHLWWLLHNDLSQLTQPEAAVPFLVTLTQYLGDGRLEMTQANIAPTQHIFGSFSA